MTEIHGRDRVEAVTVAAVDEANGRRPIPGTEETIECDTLLLSVGLIPENELTRAAGIDISRATSGADVNQLRETSAPGVYACGNVLHVHDLVDFVSEEAVIAGTAAADRILGRTAPVVKTLPVTAGDGIRYTVPERIDLTAEPEDVRIFFRVRDVYKKVQLLVETEDGEVLVRRAKSAAAPGEMESLTVPADKLKALTGTDCAGIRVTLKETGGKAK